MTRQFELQMDLAECYEQRTQLEEEIEEVDQEIDKILGKLYYEEHEEGDE